MQTSALPAPASPVNFTKSQASVLLDLIRGLAAVTVLIEHGRNILFVDYNDIAAHRSWFALPYLLTRAGHQAVLIFFVLSGYLIGGSIFRSLDKEKFRWTEYMTHRLVRLWVVLVPCLTLGVLLDWTGMHFGHAPRLYDGTLNAMIPNVPQNTSWPTFLGNLFFVQTLWVPRLGSNTALWSLTCEFWYYMLFPLLWLALVYRRTKLLSRILYVAATFAIMFCLTLPIRLLFPIWLLGIVLARLPTVRLSAWVRVLAAVVYVPLAMLEPVVNPFKGRILYPELWEDYLLGVLTMIFLWVMLSAKAPAPDSRFTRSSRLLSRFSFTLYVVHLPFLAMMTAMVEGEQRWQPTIGHAAAGIALCVLAMLFAWALASVTEFRTDSVRKWVERRLHLTRQPQSSPHERALHGS